MPFIFLVFLTLVTLAAAVSHVLVIPVLRVSKHLNPDLRSHLLMLLAAAPWLIGSGVLLSSVGDVLFGACDETTACLWDGDPTRMTMGKVLIVLPVALATLALAFHGWRQILAARKIVTTLDSISLQGDTPALQIVPSDTGFAFAGSRNIYVSQRLKDGLPPAEYQAVLLHERAHLQRHDGFYQGLAGVLTACYLPPFRRRILNALALANEEACDQRAASGVGAQHTASAILTVARMRQNGPCALLPGFADGFTEERVKALLAPDAGDTQVGLIRSLALLSIVGVFLLGDVLYYLCLDIL